MLEEDLSRCSIDDFGTFYQKLNTVLATTCKLDELKCSKRTMQNNPWITGGLIVSINHCHDVYKAWVKVRKVKCTKGEKDSKGGSCFCTICIIKRDKYVKYQNYRRTLNKTRDCAKAKYNCNKFKENHGNSKKTWELINKLRGKQQRKLKPMFTIDNEKITNQRIIANEFNKYFVSLASKLKGAGGSSSKFSRN